MHAARVASVRVAAMSMRSKVTQRECEPCAFVWFPQSLTQHGKKGLSTSEDARASRRRGGGRYRNRNERGTAEKAFVDKTDC